MFAIRASSRSQLRQTLNSFIHYQSQKGELEKRDCEWFNTRMLYSHIIGALQKIVDQSSLLLAQVRDFESRIIKLCIVCLYIREFR